MPGGKWHLQSDHDEYFRSIRDLLNRHASLTEIPWDDTGVGPEPDWKGTNYEIKYACQGRDIFRAAYARR